jgi:hypothetical protein
MTTTDTSKVAMPPTALFRKRYKEYEVSDELFKKFKNGHKIKFERWHNYFEDLEESESSLCDDIKKSLSGSFVLIRNKLTNEVKALSIVPRSVA